MSKWETISGEISSATGADFHAVTAREVAGGCINDTVVLEDLDRAFFVKFNRPELAAMFAAESAGLEALLDTDSIRAPRPIAQGVDEERAWLALEYVSLCEPMTRTNTQLGEQLATMHNTSADYFGWYRDNTIGSTPQHNTRCEQWTEFWRKYRLGYQLSLARDNNAPPSLLDAGDQLLENLDGFFRCYTPSPALLHGDLWGGNWGTDEHGLPVIFDPAVYFGDREADLAMTELFGGFDAQFYDAYSAAWPLDPGYAVRKTLYNLYHVLNHFNLFGGSYGRQAESMIHQLLAELS